MTLADVERAVILARLRRCGGDKPAAAESLGVSLKTLYNKLNIYAEQGHRVPPPPSRVKRVLR